jgi:hypothetical protein
MLHGTLKENKKMYAKFMKTVAHLPESIGNGAVLSPAS